MRLRLILACVAIAAVAIPSFPQNSAARLPSFEVASIKPNNSGENRVMIRTLGGGRFSTVGTNLKLLIGIAYRVRNFQISGGPNWITSDRFDIEAKAEASTDAGPEQMPPLLQSLLADRFSLKLHSETKELPVYELVVAKNGSKLHPVPEPARPAPGTPFPSLPRPGGPMPPGTFRLGRGEIVSSAVQLPDFIQAMSQQLGRTIVDKTGLTGFFDITLQWAPEVSQTAAALGSSGPEGAPPPAAEPAGPSIFTAIQEQLGLRLESTKGPVEVLVIDSVERPSDN